MLERRMRFARVMFSVIVVVAFCAQLCAQEDELARAFQDPPLEARPGVYWYFMDGNLSRAGMTADLESMRASGIGNLVFLEVNVGVPRGPVDFLSEAWQELFAHAVHEAERLGIDITLGSGPGWAGSGGPWVEPERSMQHLVASAIETRGPASLDAVLSRPEPRAPFFGDGSLSEELRRTREEYYEDVAVLAFRTPRGEHRLADVDEKALYYRAPYSSVPGVKPYLPAPAHHDEPPKELVIHREEIVDLSDRLQPDGRLAWQVPAGEWTIMRFGRRNNGATTRPAPQPGLGFECDKLCADALDDHFQNYAAKLLEKVGSRAPAHGWTMLHIDSWEMGSQNWTARFREEFRRRRGYDLLPYLPTYVGRVVESVEVSERFLWDMRLTAQELVLENHAGHLKALGRRHGFGLSIEPYDMNPTSDMELGSVADVPMCEFWSDGYGFDTTFSVLEATSIAHTQGRSVVAAEAFTATHEEAWKQYPGVMKNQGDWAYCQGINRFVYHTFAHKPQEQLPGMTMGPYGVHWDRGQTWWPMVSAYHRYITRCQHMLRQGEWVADVCYLAPEGAPHVFRPPPSALTGQGMLRDRRGYNFDGCAPGTLLARAEVRDGLLAFPGGSSYRLLVLPAMDTMTPELLAKIKELVEAGATVVGPPPVRSPSLVDYPRCDDRIASLSRAMWGDHEPTEHVRVRKLGKGHLVWGGPLAVTPLGTSQPGPIVLARWIWCPDDQPAMTAPMATRYFRRELMVDADQPVRSARVEVTADNSFELWVNGRQALTGDNFHVIHRQDVTELLRPGKNVLAIAVTNTGSDPNPAGLVAALRLQYEDGDTADFVTDDQWKAAREVPANWQNLVVDGSGWVDAQELGPLGMDPWRVRLVPDQCPDLYPHYAATSQLLADADLPPDFESDGPVRYTHRRTHDRDIYFVSSCSPDVVRAECRFRVSGASPQLWDPLSGSVRSLPEFVTRQGRTTIPLRFEPYESYFIVFARQPVPETQESRASRNFATYRTVGSIDGPWDVVFDPQLGGPERVQFAQLQDWSRHEQPSIKYYSGVGTYRCTFDLPESWQGSAEPILLDLGVVHNLARVRVNGQDLGVVWCAPWHVPLPVAWKATGNVLEIEVANLWPNRLIGDKALPPEQQVARTTFNPYSADAPLLPSGLLGPVTLKTVSAE